MKRLPKYNGTQRTRRSKSTDGDFHYRMLIVMVIVLPALLGASIGSILIFK